MGSGEDGGCGWRVGTATNSITQILVCVQADSQFHEWNQNHHGRVGGGEREQSAKNVFTFVIYTGWFCFSLGEAAIILWLNTGNPVMK